MPATIGNPCVKSATTVANTGNECGVFLGVMKGFCLVDPSLKWTSADEVEPIVWFTEQIHARKIFPVTQGDFDFAPTQESDVTEQNPLRGTSKVRRRGGFTLLYTFDDGGLCLAKALQTFEGKGYRLMMFDQNGLVQRRKNQDGTFSGLKTDNFSAGITFASLNNSAKNTATFSLSQDEIIKYSDIISVDGGDVTELEGLLDVILTDAGGSTITALKFGVKTECAGTDLVAEYGAALADIDLYVIKNAAGTVITPTGYTIVSGHVQAAGAFPTTGNPYTVNPTTPAVWLANDIPGYDGSNGAVSLTTV